MKIDARTLPKETQEEKRRTAITLWKKSMPTAEISEIVEVSIRSVQLWISTYKKGGLSALKSKPFGHQVGVGRTLTQEQECRIKSVITDHYPDQHKLDYALWTLQGSDGVDRNRMWHSDAYTNGWRIFKTMGYDASKATKTGLRATSSGSKEVA